MAFLVASVILKTIGFIVAVIFFFGLIIGLVVRRR